MRAFVLLVSFVLLGACTNMVRSETPWFGPADAIGAPALRDGVWAAVDPECAFDTHLALEEWPDCAQRRIVRGGEELNLNRSGGGDRVDYNWSSEAFVLTAGELRINQRACGEPHGLREAEESPESSAVDEAVSRLVYCYAALRAEALDADGRIVAFTTWPIWCGPQPAQGEGNPNVTNKPFPGLTVVGEYCVADDVAALRAAATATEMLLPDPRQRARFRWIRDGWR
ncbi:hypothetical protein [Brevundimonas sp. Root1279]|uniref:hypothetical protein n=1 Tax=Brevundimonas sp. Root1279 TaxID=1736443 RepID=UPI0006FD15C3|nr:hypothetical protein [Brevundimonas sp. Root1279]KQW83120.1 hypothetical protein ASC65_07250 [Brevundimonas sp. Root1279]